MATAKKEVLVSYLERNKVVSIPVSESADELSYLKKEFNNIFSFGSNVNLLVTFQKFDKDWGEYIDLETPAVLSDKDKLKAVVTPLLVDSTPVQSSLSSVGTEGRSIINSSLDVTYSSLDLECHEDGACITDSTSVDLADSDNTDFEAPLSSKRMRLTDSDSETECNSGSVHQSCTSSPKSVLPSVVRRKRKEEKPLPDPFPLPKNYRPDIEVGLRTGKMSRETKAAFLSSIAAAMFSYKMYPEREEYSRIAYQIVAQYPFLKSSKGSCFSSVKQSLMNRFKELRRTPKERAPSSGESSKKILPQKRKSPGLDSILKPPEIPPGEDETSFKRHNKVLQMEYKKSKPNMAVVTSLMERTYAFRRADILANPSVITEILSKYPFLQNVEQLFLEMQRIVDVEQFQSSVRNSWIKVWSPRILSQAAVESQKNKRLSKVMKDIPTDENTSFIISLIYLVYMLPDRIKPDHENVVYAVPETCDIERAVANKRQSEPYVLIIGTYQQPVQAYLVIDSVTTVEINCKDIVSILLSSFFVFNICYTKGCQNLFQFFEQALLNFVNKTVPPSVNHFMASLENVNTHE